MASTHKSAERTGFPYESATGFNHALVNYESQGQSLPRRPIPAPGGVFSKPASQPKAPPVPHPHLHTSLSSGDVLEKNAASAAVLSFPKEMPQATTGLPGASVASFATGVTGNEAGIHALADTQFSQKKAPQAGTGSAGAAFAHAKGATADESHKNGSAQGFPPRLGITMNVSPTTSPEGANLRLSDTDAEPKPETALEWAIRKDAAETPDEKARRKKLGVMSREEHFLMNERQEAHKDQSWDLFYRAIRRGRQLYTEYRAIDPKPPRLKALEHCCFACRMYAGRRSDENGERSVTIGYAEGELAWMGAHKCGAGRFCVLCGAQIAAKNQEDIETGLRNAIAKGWSALMLTYTFPHLVTHTATESVENLALACKLAGKGGDMTRFRKKYGIVGHIVRQEETYGLHGWHPHLHVIVFFDHVLSEEEIAEVTEKFKQKWQAACYKVGIIPPNRTRAFEERGFLAEPILNIEQVADYLAKVGWKNSSTEFKAHAKEAILENSGKRIKGAAFELSARDAKAPRLAEGRTPWDILEGFANGDPRDTELWLDYIEAFHGKPMVRWSPHLKADLGIRDKYEEEQVKADEEDSLRHIYRVSADHYADGVARNGLWRPIVKAIDKGEFDKLQEIADRYVIDFKPAKKRKDARYPEILSQVSVQENKAEAERQRKREAVKRSKEKVKTILAAREAKKQARLAAEQAYAVSLLSPDDVAQMEVARRANRQKKQEERRKRRDLRAQARAEGKGNGRAA